LITFTDISEGRIVLRRRRFNEIRNRHRVDGRVLSLDEIFLARAGKAMIAHSLPHWRGNSDDGIGGPDRHHWLLVRFWRRSSSPLFERGQRIQLDDERFAFW